MKKSRFSEAQILGILRQQDEGLTVAQICREHGISEPTFYSWMSRRLYLYRLSNPEKKLSVFE